MERFKEIILGIFWYFPLMSVVFFPVLILFCSLNNIARGISFVGILIQDFGDFLAIACAKLVKYIIKYGDKLFLE